MTLTWTTFKAADNKTLVCNCGNVFRSWVQQVEGVNYTYRPCVNCASDRDVKEIWPLDQYKAKRAEAGLP